MSQLYRPSQPLGQSQISKTQQQTANMSTLAELHEYFSKKNTELNPANFTNYDLNDEDFDADINSYMANLNLCDEPITSNFDSQIDEFTSNLARFEKLYLSEPIAQSGKFTYDQLFMSKNVLSNLHYLLFASCRDHVGKLSADALYGENSNDNQIQINLVTILGSMDSIFGYLLQQSKIRYEHIYVFTLSSLNAMVLVHKYLMKTSNAELNRKHRDLLHKIFNVILLKHVDNSISENVCLKSSLTKLCKFASYFLEHFFETKMIISLWRVIYNILCSTKLQLYLNLDLNDIDLRILAQKIPFQIQRILKENFLYLETSYGNLNDPLTADCSAGSMSQFNAERTCVSTQVTLANNILQDTSKVIKLIEMFFKICRSFFVSYFNLLMDTETCEGAVFCTITNLLSTAVYFCFFEFKMGVVSSLDTVVASEGSGNAETADDDEENKENNTTSDNINNEAIYRSLKTEYLTKMCRQIEIMMNFLLAMPAYQQFLLISFQKLNFDVDDDELDPKKLERNLVFCAIFFNRVNSANQTSQESEEMINVLFDYLDLCVISFGSLDYFLFDKKFMNDQLDFSSITCTNTSSPQCLSFYDFAQTLLLRFVLNLNKPDFLIYGLCNNLTLNLQAKYLIRVQASHDLLIAIFKLGLGNHKQTFGFLKFISDFYEIISKENTNTWHLQSILVQLFTSLVNGRNGEKIANSILTQLSDYYASKKYSMCYSVFYATCVSKEQRPFGESITGPKSTHQAFVKNLFKNAIEFYASHVVDISKPSALQLSIFSHFKHVDFDSLNLISQTSLQDLALSLARRIREYLDKKYSSSVDNLNPNNLILKNTISVYYKLICKLSLKGDLEFLIGMLVKLYARLGVSLKFSLVHFVYTFLIAAGNETLASEDIKKLSEAISAVLTDTSEYLQIFCLECLNDAMTRFGAIPPPLYSAIILNITKTSRHVSDQIMQYMIESPNSVSIDPANEIQYFRQRFLAVSSHMMNRLRPIMNQKASGMLNDTMSALGAMEATQQQHVMSCPVTGSVHKEEDETVRFEIESKIESLCEFIDSCESGEKFLISEGLKIKLRNLSDLILSTL